MLHKTQLIVFPQLLKPILATLVSSFLLGAVGFIVKFLLESGYETRFAVLVLVIYFCVFGLSVFLRNVFWSQYGAKILEVNINRIQEQLNKNLCENPDRSSEFIRILSDKLIDFGANQLNLVSRFSLTALCAFVALLAINFNLAILTTVIFVTLGLVLKCIFSLGRPNIKQYELQKAHFFGQLSHLISGQIFLLNLGKPFVINYIWKDNLTKFLVNLRRKSLKSALLQAFGVLTLSVCIVYTAVFIFEYSITAKKTSLGFLTSLAVFFVSSVIFFSFLPKYFESKNELAILWSEILNGFYKPVETLAKTLTKTELYIKELKKRYDNFVLEARNIRLVGGFYFVVGPNGSGKSTFLKILSGNLEGEVLRVISNSELLSDKDLRSLCCYLNSNVWAIDGTVKDNLFTENTNLLPNFLDVLGIEESFLSKNMVELSAGERQLINLFRAVTCDKSVLIFDESFNSVSECKQLQIVNFLKRFCNKIILFVTHNTSLPSYQDQIISVVNGHVIHGISTYPNRGS
ncbi:MAG: ABC transporter ATP-binding protein/permease [Deltaproteobacteria bacterium]|nr:ABC transporter ATP-binding protein/permease [Deltaproteobacteria bacterium]